MELGLAYTNQFDGLKSMNTFDTVPLTLYADGVPFDLNVATKVTLHIGTDSGYVGSMDLDITTDKSLFNQGIISFPANQSFMQQLPPDIYYIEIWVEADSGNLIFPSNGILPFTVSDNLMNTSENGIYSMTLYEFVNNINELTNIIENKQSQLSKNQQEIDSLIASAQGFSDKFNGLVDDNRQKIENEIADEKQKNIDFLNSNQNVFANLASSASNDTKNIITSYTNSADSQISGYFVNQSNISKSYVDSYATSAGSAFNSATDRFNNNFNGFDSAKSSFDNLSSQAKDLIQRLGSSGNSNNAVYHGTWNNKGLLDLQYQPDGVYEIETNNIDTVNGWDHQNSQILKNSTSSNTVTLLLIDSHENMWINTNLSGAFQLWNKISNSSDINSLASSFTSAIQNKADLNDFNSLSSSVNNNVKSALDSKADKGSVDSQISNISNSLDSKVNKSDVENKLSNISGSVADAVKPTLDSKADKNYVDNQLSNVNNALNNKVSFNGGYITTGNGSFIPAGIDSTLPKNGNLTDSILSLKDKKSGYYELMNNKIDAPDGFSGYGIAFVYGQADGDTDIYLWSAEGIWKNHWGLNRWYGWDSISMTSNLVQTIKQQVNSGDKLDDFNVNGTYPINGISLGGLASNLGLPSLDNFWGELKVEVKRNEIVQTINDNVGNYQMYRVLGQKWSVHDMHALDDQSLQYRGVFGGNVLDLKDQKDGRYWLTGSNTNGPTGDNLWGDVLKITMNPYDVLLTCYIGGNIWLNSTTNNQWSGWTQQARTSDLANMQNTLARQLTDQKNSYDGKIKSLKVEASVNSFYAYLASNPSAWQLNNNFGAIGGVPPFGVSFKVESQQYLGNYIFRVNSDAFTSSSDSYNLFYFPTTEGPVNLVSGSAPNITIDGHILKTNNGNTFTQFQNAVFIAFKYPLSALS